MAKRATEHRRPAVRDESTRERVIRSATHLFAERGFHGTGIRDLAESAELTTSALYYYMSNKDDLLVEIMERTITPLRQAAERILKEMDSPAAALCSIVEHHVWLHASDRLATIVTDTELRALTGDNKKRIVRLRDQYEACWREAVAAGIKARVFETASPELAARSLLQSATGVSHWFSPSGPVALPRLCEIYADGALGFLRAKHASGRPLRRSDLTLPGPDEYLK